MILHIYYNACFAATGSWDIKARLAIQRASLHIIINVAELYYESR